jgi:hypothetical protein
MDYANYLLMVGLITLIPGLVVLVWGVYRLKRKNF